MRAKRLSAMNAMSAARSCRQHVSCAKTVATQDSGTAALAGKLFKPGAGLAQAGSSAADAARAWTGEGGRREWATSPCLWDTARLLHA